MNPIESKIVRCVQIIGRFQVWDRFQAMPSTASALSYASYAEVRWLMQSSSVNVQKKSS